MATITSISGRVGQIADRAIPAGEDLLQAGGFISQIVGYDANKPMVLHKLGVQMDEGDYIEINDVFCQNKNLWINDMDSI